jgi:hypothetical protein
MNINTLNTQAYDLSVSWIDTDTSMNIDTPNTHAYDLSVSWMDTDFNEHRYP